MIYPPHQPQGSLRIPPCRHSAVRNNAYQTLSKSSHTHTLVQDHSTALNPDPLLGRRASTLTPCGAPGTQP